MEISKENLYSDFRTKTRDCNVFIYILFFSVVSFFYNKVDTMDISAGVLVREGNIVRRGPRQVNKNIVLSIWHEKIYMDIFLHTFTFTFIESVKPVRRHTNCIQLN